MNLSHLHLLINHLPIIGSMLGGLVLAFAIWEKSNRTKVAAYGVLIISSIGAVIAYLTGEPAEELVENIPGVLKSAIEQHEDAAMVSLIVLIMLGISSVIGIYLTYKNSQYIKRVATITLFLSILSFGFIARVGYLGGQIRHTELSTVAPIDAQFKAEEKEED
jgi:uncharacterized membrane protein